MATRDLSLDHLHYLLGQEQREEDLGWLADLRLLLLVPDRYRDFRAAVDERLVGLGVLAPGAAATWGHPDPREVQRRDAIFARWARDLWPRWPEGDRPSW